MRRASAITFVVLALGLTIAASWGSEKKTTASKAPCKSAQEASVNIDCVL